MKKPHVVAAAVTGGRIGDITLEGSAPKAFGAATTQAATQYE